MNAVLMVAYLYPPGAGSSGVLRPLKFSRFLPDHGWIPHVLTAHESLYSVKDPSLLREVPAQAVIHRTWAVDSARHLAIRRRHLAALSVPDPYVTWLPFGVARGLRVIRRAGIRALYSTSPPATSHLIAGTLHRLTGRPWIADFRDPWIEEGIHPEPGSLRHRVESALERWVVRGATLITATTQYLRGDLLRRYPELAPDRVAVLSNGYDEDDFAGLPARPAADSFEIIHAGLVNAEFRDPRPVLQAVSDLVAAGRIARDTVRVTFVGLGPWVRSPEFRGSIRRLGLEDIVEVVPFVPHREALGRTSRAAVLLLLQAGDDLRSMIPAKAFEYLRSGLPVLALAHEGATSDLLKGHEGCHVMAPEDGAGIRDTVAALYAAWQRDPAGLAVPRPVEQYERRHITAALARHLDAVAGRTTT